jgi:hypothetical protein
MHGIPVFLDQYSRRALGFSVHPAPLAYPCSLASLASLLQWALYLAITQAVMAAFGIRARVLTPNLVCVMTKAGEERR